MSFAPSDASSPVPPPEEERVHAAFVRPPAVAESSALDLTLRLDERLGFYERCEKSVNELVTRGAGAS